MSVLALKCIAAASMLLDHIGYLTNSELLRCAGRLAFPIYAWLIGNGFRHTRHPGKYLARLLLLAFVSQIPYTLFLTGNWHPVRLNVFVTLSLGLGLIWALEGCDGMPTKLLCFLCGTALCFALEQVLPLDYGPRGVLLIAAFYLCRGSKPAMAAAFTLLYGLPLWNALLTTTPLPTGWQRLPFALLSLPLLWQYNGEAGYRSLALQWFWYLFYPAHLLVLYGLFG